MNKTELKQIARFLEELSNRFDTDGCNDMELEDTAENRTMINSAEKLYDPESDFVAIPYKGKLSTNNSTLLDYLKAKFEKENGI